MEVVTINGYQDVPENDEQSLLKALAHQPVSVAIEASGRDFQFYSGVSLSRTNYEYMLHSKKWKKKISNNEFHAICRVYSMVLVEQNLIMEWQQLVMERQRVQITSL